jgi:hypothetical protein
MKRLVATTHAPQLFGFLNHYIKLAKAERPWRLMVIISGYQVTKGSGCSEGIISVEELLSEMFLLPQPIFT